ncbi:MAG: DNA internalization-related competence protein ComEC/Rec2 [Clostridia bacterium]
MKRPLLIAAIAYINGILIGVYLSKSIPLFVILSIIVSLITSFKKNTYRNAICMYLIVMCIFSIYVYNKNLNYESKYKKYDNKNISIEGTIISDIEEKEYNYTFTIRTKDDYFLVNLKKNKEEISLEYGDKLQISGEYQEPNKARNYKGFDYKNYLKINKIYGIIRVDLYTNIIIKHQKNLSNFKLLIHKIREKLKQNIQELLTKETYALGIGILIGDNSRINEKIVEDFKNSNLSHMLAVSGAHINYVVLTVSILFTKKRAGIKAQRVVTIMMMLFFMELTQMTSSVVRAGISCIIYMLASLLYRKADVINAMAISTLLILLNNPFKLFDIGFQLSYAGTLGIILFCKLINIPIKNKLLKYLKDSIIISISANIFIIPIMMYQFNTISLTFILSNLLAGPLLGISIILEIIVLLISFMSINIAAIPAKVLNILLILIINIANWFSNIEISKIYVITPKIISIVAYYLICAAIILKQKNRKIIVIIMLTVLIINLFPTPKKLRINFIDVGQGDSTLIRTETNKVILIDSGGSTASSSFDVGNKVLLPYLLDRRIKKIDFIIVSHFDADHCQAFETVIDNINVRKVVVCKQSMITQEYLNIINKCKKKNIKIIVVERGDKLKIDKRTEFEILHPGERFLDDGKGGLNANAIVCKMNYKLNNGKIFSILFTGDIEVEAEKELEQVYGKKLKADILKIAHHGSKTSSREEFIKLVSPKIALIGVGENNKFGHPADITLERLEKENVKVYRTDQMGEVSITINKNGEIKVKTQIN